MAAVPQFGKITTAQEDLFKKKYCYGSLAQAMIKSKVGDFQWKAHAKQRGEPCLHSGAFEYTYKDAKFTVRKTTNPSFKGTFEYNCKDFVPGLKVKGELLAQTKEGALDRPFGGAIEYASNDASARLAITNDGVAKGSVTVMNDGKFGFGLDGAFDSGKSRFTAYNAAFWMVFDQSTLCLKHLGTCKEEYKLGSLVNSFHRKLEKGEVGGLIKTEIESMKTEMEFGGAYQPWDDAEARAKFNNKGKVGLSWVQKLREGLTLTVSSLLDSTKLSSSGLSDFEFGCRFDFEP